MKSLIWQLFCLAVQTANKVIMITLDFVDLLSEITLHSALTFTNPSMLTANMPLPWKTPGKRVSYRMELLNTETDLNDLPGKVHIPVDSQISLGLKGTKGTKSRPWVYLCSFPVLFSPSLKKHWINFFIKNLSLTEVMMWKWFTGCKTKINEELCSYSN